MKFKLQPLGDRIVIKRLEADKKTPGGIIIPDVALEKMAEGVIVEIGYGRQQEDGYVRPLDVKAGQHVLFGKYSGTDVKVNNEELLLIKEEDIFGVLIEITDEAEALARIEKLEAELAGLRKRLADRSPETEKNTAATA